MNQTVFTFTTVVEPARLDELQQTLATIQNDLNGNQLLRFRDLGVVHFASINLFPPDELTDSQPCSGPPINERRREWYFVWENNIDGPIEPYVDALLRKFGAGTYAIIRCCRNAPATNDTAELKRYLMKHIVKPSAYHVGTPWREVQRITDESKLRDAIEDVADTVTGSDPATARSKMQNAIRENPDFAFAKKNAPAVSFFTRLQPWLPVIMRLPELIVRAVILIITLPYLRWLELTDCEWKGDVDPTLEERLGARENFIAQNHMANMSDVKPGFVRSNAVRAVLLIANITARRSTQGLLAGIPSIHFAHWALLDGGKRLLFCSNFGGSWENYLDDFIDKANRGLTGIWGHTIGFPRTKWIFYGGATNAARFKAIARNKQVPSSVWYSAYKKLTVQAIDNNSAIRKDLFTPLDAEGTKQWLRRL